MDEKITTFDDLRIKTIDLFTSIEVIIKFIEDIEDSDISDSYPRIRNFQRSVGNKKTFFIDVTSFFRKLLDLSNKEKSSVINFVNLKEYLNENSKEFKDQILILTNYYHDLERKYFLNIIRIIGNISPDNLDDTNNIINKLKRIVVSGREEYKIRKIDELLKNLDKTFIDTQIYPDDQKNSFLTFKRGV